MPSFEIHFRNLLIVLVYCCSFSAFSQSLENSSSLSNQPAFNCNASTATQTYAAQANMNADVDTVTDNQVDRENENNKRITVDADAVKIDEKQRTRFEGDVVIHQGENKIRADLAHATNNNRSIVAKGNIRFSRPQAEVTSELLLADLTHNELKLIDSQYKLSGNKGHGQAQKLIVSERNQDLTMYDASFTTCPPEDNPDWMLNASEITFSAAEEWGESWHNWFELSGVPVMYMPYLSFPLTDKRKSGFLLPQISNSSKKGLDVVIPYYWNISPQLDATMSVRSMSKRGDMYRNELRYLNNAGRFKLYGEWLAEDDDYKNDDSRGAYNFNYSGAFYNDWQAYANLTKFSDESYLNDFSFKGISRSDTNVESIVSLYQHQDNWSLEMNLRRFEVFGDHAEPYQTVPEIKAEFSPESGFDNVNFWVPLELTYFLNEDTTENEALRFHTEPTVEWFYNQPAWEVSAETSFLSTVYAQDTVQLDGTTESETLTRTMPRVRLNGRVILERPIDWFGKNMTQTLEPRVQYLWVPYRDQNDIGIYDTTLLQDDYHGLYRASRFSGVDRIIEANQISIGATSRLINSRNQDKLKLSIGQIFYLHDPEVDIFDQEVEIARGESAFAVDVEADIRKRWFFRYGLQYDTELEQTNKSQTTLDYRLDKATFAQLSHRFVRDVSDNTINMVGSHVQWQLNNKWQTFADYYHDMEEDRTLESRLGIQYKSCCWGIQFAWQSQLLSDLDADDSSSSFVSDEYDRGFSLRFTMGAIGHSNSNNTGLLSDTTFGYRKPYFLNQ